MLNKCVFFFKFIHFKREIEKAQVGEGQREGETESQAGFVHAIRAEADVGLKLMNSEIMTWAEIKSWTLNWLSHPGAPKCDYF